MAESTTRCERCERRRATVHWTYGHGAAQQERHFCQRCSQGETPGWRVVAEGRAGVLSPLVLLAAAALAAVAIFWLRG